MAKKEQAVLEVKLEQKSLIADLEKQKRSLVSSKEELNKLNAAYKQGSITLEEYAADAVRIEAILKKQTAAYQNTQKAVTGHKSKIDELIKSNSKLSSSLTTAANDINIAGTNVGALGTKIASLANPITAGITLIGALGAAYARSTLGAKDLEFAQTQLASATTLATNAFAEFLGVSDQDGGGFVSNFLNAFISKFSQDIAAKSRAMAFLAEEAEDLGRKEIEIRGQVSERLADNQEKLTKISEEQTSYNEKVRLSNEIIKSLTQNQNDLKKVLSDQLSIINRQLGFDKNNDALLTEKIKKVAEINKITTDTTRKIEAQQRALSNIVGKERERVKEQEAADKTEFSAVKILSDPRKDLTEDGLTAPDTSVLQSKLKLSFDILRVEKKLKDDLAKINKEQDLERMRRNDAVNKAMIENNKQLVGSTADMFGALSGIFDEGSQAQKTFALLSIGVNTAEAISELTAAAEGNPLNAFTFGGAGIGQFVVGLGRIFANMALAKRYLGGFAEGGWTGPGSKYDVAGVVHKDEYVVPKDVNNNPMATPHLRALEAMRVKGYADGGFVTQQNTMASKQTLTMINAMKMMPPPKLSVVEFTRVQDRVQTRENTVKI